MSFEQPKFEELSEIKTDKTEQQGEKIMEVPEIIVQPEKGINLMSFMLKGYNPEWGDNDHELSRATNEYFEKNPLSDEIRKSLDDLRALKKDGIDQEVLFNIALSYGHPERLKETSANLMRDKELDNPDEVQEKLLKLMEDLDKKLNSDPKFLELKDKFDIETRKDIETRRGGLEKRKEEIDKLLEFFRPKAETTKAKRINIIPTDYLYNKESGMSFSIGDEIIIRAPLEDSENGQWTHEFLHGVINPINDKLYGKLTDEQKEKIIKMSPGKLKQHYGENANTLLNESFIRTYVNLFDKGSGPYNYEYFKKLIPGVSEKQFQDFLKYDKELKQRMDALGISSFKEFSEKSEQYFEKYEEGPLSNIIYRLYGDYQKELQSNKKLTFEDFVSSRFINYLDLGKE
ncbi:MAG: hypothetical protein HYW69_03335 [Candidatus Nealsonbacteria bacterium]|nr:hypothetical protein [Candidatus Nealsonbacteria bacterium]